MSDLSIYPLDLDGYMSEVCRDRLARVKMYYEFQLARRQIVEAYTGCHWHKKLEAKPDPE